jgi:ribosomal protein S18 acetylase RimI-like enzyme
MLLRCCIAEPKDAPRIAEIHMAAFASNAMLLAQFRSAEVRHALQHSIRLKAVADIEDPNTTVLIVKRGGVHTMLDEKESSSSLGTSSSDGSIIAFAKWAHPTKPDDEYEEPPWVWPEGTALDVLDGWTRLVEEAQTTAMGSQACYRKSLSRFGMFNDGSFHHSAIVQLSLQLLLSEILGLTFIATDPRYQRHGAGALMVAWGLGQCEKERVSAYLESTEEAVNLYKKQGFEAALEICMMVTFESNEGGVIAQEYKEVGMVYRPKTISGNKSVL